ncbi:peptidyl-tRNA hydrolase [Actinomadura madurae]|uniref:peptidyl-tRNA hydrolase n=1 Tax=Actinomadura madurae TaxID=1993 RepID=UPI0020D25590|nr:peptidyl-tRNA hydrolase [Actinomadura madurae]MCP9954496.1 peptidyl-tRNA hydrolase [Actinomadura madurae]
MTRRARGVRWPEAEALPGVTVQHAGAQVRAFPPGPVSDVPPQLAKLQVAGLDLPDEAEPGPPPEPPYAAIALNPDVTITTGKAAAQCGHAAQLLLRRGRRRHVAAWVEAGARVHLARDVPWSRCVKEAAVAVRDGGFTEVAPGTMTATAWLVRR